MVRESRRFRWASFEYAWEGLRYLWRTQPNARIHAVATGGVAGIALWLRIAPLGWAALSLALGLVWMAEAFNTALEVAVDLCSPQPHPLAKASKDAGAAAVLLAVLTAVAVGLAVLGPPLWVRLGLGG